MNTVPEELLSEFVKACHEAASRRLMRCSSGNMSWRVDEKHMLVTASRSWMGRLSPEDVVICSIEDGAVVSGKKPTIEISFHAGILRARPDINVVMHFQTPFAATLACLRPGNINYCVIPEIPFYIGPVAQVPYLLPGTRELAEAVTEAMCEHDLVIMSNHGHVTVARHFDQVIENAEFFELACGIILRGGDAVAPLPEAAVRELMGLKEGG